ncbi:hypothetical protein BC835DRAFT_1415416 [Cytidiella melzeri]|nr:hypothetical protein BC835DRAFT_1415416 [Cytidiella melzeri]
MVIAKWLMHSANPSYQEMCWSLEFSLDTDDAVSETTSQVLRVLGPTLTGVDLTVDVSGKRDINCQDLLLPDFSHNTGLTSVELLNVVPGFCPADYLSSVFSTVNSTNVKMILVEFTIDTIEQAELNGLDFAAFERVLLHEGRFPKLHAVSLNATPSSDEGFLTQEYIGPIILEKVPDLVESRITLQATLCPFKFTG